MCDVSMSCGRWKVVISRKKKSVFYLNIFTFENNSYYRKIILKNKKMRTSILILTCIFLLTFNLYSQESRLMRFPTIYGNDIVFSYGGDLYKVSKQGGIARKLTTDVGYEMFPRFSPDGTQLAFTAQYDGNTEIYIMPSQGGEPKRLTYTATLKRDEISDRMGPNNIVMGWTPDGQNIIYRTRAKTFNDFVGHLYMVNKEGGLPLEVTLSTGGFCSFSPDGKQLAFNRVFREFRTWKYYKGGMADDIRIFDLTTKKIINITNHISQDIIPMWIEQEIYFLSDRDRIMNLFAYHLQTKEIRKLTHYTDYDIKFPSHSKDAIVFEKGGFIYVFDVKTQQVEKVSVIIADDMIAGRNKEKDASKNTLNMDISPDGERLVSSARGDIFTIPSEAGITRNLTQTPGVHERHAEWSPDGKYIAYISDRTGENEIYIQHQDGTKESVQITRDADTYYFRLKWSPNSKYILWSDKKLRLRYVDVNTKTVTEVAKSKIWEYSNFDWSPDSKWITYSNSEANGLSTIKLFSIDNKNIYDVSDYWYRSYGSTFSLCGKYLFFISDRDFEPIYSRTEWNHAYDKMSKIYFVGLSKETPNPFSHKNNEVKIEEAEKRPEKSETKDKENEDKTVKEEILKIDTAQLNMRILSLPIDVADYYSITGWEDKVFYMKNDSKKTALMLYDLKEQKETEILECSNYKVCANKKKFLISKDGKYYIINIPSSSVKLEKNVSLNDMKLWVDLSREWPQIFYESWRQMRDFFYVENMHGVDWEGIKKKYEVLLPFVKHRHDLNYVIGEMIGELSVGHAYVNGGDLPELKRIPLGLLGAVVQKDISGYYKIIDILEGASWSQKLRAPLSEPGINIKKGDFIIAIDGFDVKRTNNLYQLLVNKAHKAVEITVNNKPENNNSKKYIIKPIDDESELYYYRWVQQNIKKVNEATAGQVGYIHIPDMGVGGLNEFVKHFYPQLDKKALIIDDRGNGGGNVSPMILERLLRRVQRANMSRNTEIPSQTPRQMLLGPIVVLVNQYSASDGDLFPYGIKKYGLGKVIGVRTWGGVVGIRGTHPFIDGAVLNKPEFASYDAKTGEWIIEGYGVEPDIVIDNDPYEEYMGKDSQLDKAIAEILNALKDYKPLPDIPEGPDKSK